MAYALFSQDTKISRTYPTEAEVWKHAEENELVIDAISAEGQAPKRMLDKDYTIKSCDADVPETDSDSSITDFALQRAG